MAPTVFYQPPRETQTVCTVRLGFLFAPRPVSLFPIFVAVLVPTALNLETGSQNASLNPRIGSAFDTSPSTVTHQSTFPDPYLRHNSLNNNALPEKSQIDLGSPTAPGPTGRGLTWQTLRPIPQYQVRQQALRAQNRDQPQPPPIDRSITRMMDRNGTPMPPLSPPTPNEFNAELTLIPNTVLPKIKQELMIQPDKDLGAMTPEEKVFSSLSSSFVYSPFSLAPDFKPLANKVRDSTSARARYSAATPKSSRSFLDTSHCLVKRLQ